MRSTLPRVLVSLVAVVAAATGASATTRSATISPYLAKCGTAVCLHGSPVALTAGTVYGLLDQPATAASLVHQAGLKMMRITNFMDEQTTLAGATGEASWVRVDKLIAAAQAQGLLVEIDLSTYRGLLLKLGLNPYTRDWGSFVKFVANRKNTVTGIVYKNDPTIALVAVAGEPEPLNTPANTMHVTTAQLTGFYSRTLGELKAADPNHLHSSGGLLQLTWNSGIDAKAIAALPNDDLPAIHVYSQADRDTVIPLFGAIMALLNKPWWVEESGETQSVGDSARAAWFSTVEAKAYGNGAAGLGVWNIGQQVVGGSHDVNAKTPQSWSAVSKVNSSFSSNAARVKVRLN